MTYLCPKCLRTLEQSDVEGYPFVCKECDENFYTFEALDSERLVFDTHGGDSQLNCRSGERIEIVRMLDSSEFDEQEVGLMYRVRFNDGFETDAFADEIEELRAW